MTVLADEGRFRGLLRNALSEAGIDSELSTDGYVLDLESMDRLRMSARRQSALRTSASLLFRLTEDAHVTAVLPLREESQRELAASGMLFVLAQVGAELTAPKAHLELNVRPDLLPSSFAKALGSHSAWRADYSPASVELRDFLLRSVSETDIYESPRAGASLLRHARVGIVDRDFAAFVNPHRLRNAQSLSAIGQVAGPWLRKLLSTELSGGSSGVAKVVDLIGHALENVIEHAFDGSQSARSLITVGVGKRDGQRALRVQVLDNGIGIPASVAARRKETVRTSAQAAQYVEWAVAGVTSTGEPLLPDARGLGIPEMRSIAAALDGQLDITTSGPTGTQVIVECKGDRDIVPFHDQMPVVGTIVTLWAPLAPRDKGTAVPEVPAAAPGADPLPFGQ